MVQELVLVNLVSLYERPLVEKSLLSTTKFELEQAVAKALPDVNLVTSVHTRLVQVELL